MKSASLLPEEGRRKSVARFCSRWDGAFISDREWHFHRRLYERYGVVLAPGEFTMIVRRIRSRKTPVIRRKDGKLLIHVIRIPSADIVVFVVSDGRMPKTAWPPEECLPNMSDAELPRS